MPKNPFLVLENSLHALDHADFRPVRLQLIAVYDKIEEDRKSLSFEDLESDFDYPELE